MHRRRLLLFILPVVILGLVIAHGIGGQSENPVAQVWLPIDQSGIRMVPNIDQGPHHTAHAAILYERSTNTVLFGHNIHQRRAPASLTKIMTAIVAVENGVLNDIVTVSANAAATRGSSANLYAGQQIRLIDLLYGLLLNSGNDAAVAIAEHIAGSVEAFAEMMNERAREMGLQNTQFRNPHGLDEPGHYSTAFDLALLTDAAMNYPQIAEIIATKEYQWNETLYWRNTNRLLWQMQGAEGVKTGTTGQAGNCLIAAVSDDGMQLVSVVLGSSDRWADSERILNYGFSQFHRLTLVEKGEVVAEVPLPTGMGPLIAVARSPLAVVVPSDEPFDIEFRTVLDNVRPPVRRGEKVGHLEVTFKSGDSGFTLPLIAGHDIARRTPARVLWEWLSNLWA